MTAVTGGKWMERSAMETTTQDGTATLPPRITKALIGRLTGMVTAGTAGEKREPYEMIEVYTGNVIGALPQSSPEDVVAAATNARAAQREWASWPLSRRLAVFEKAHELLLAEHETIAELIQVGNG
ncbi:aldehyde dehydrogenase family protein, partial [Nocardia gipuzkoensis]